MKPLRREHLLDFGPSGANQPLRLERAEGPGSERTAGSVKAAAAALGPRSGNEKETGRRFELGLVSLMEELSSMFSDADALVRSLFDKLASPASSDEIQAEVSLSGSAGVATSSQGICS